MLKKLMCAAVLCSAPLMGETIGDVEYQIPSSAKEWKVVNQMENPKSSTIIYVPANESKADTQQAFSAHNNNLPSDMKDEATVIEGLVKTLEMYYPDMRVQGKVVAKDDNSMLFEWTVEDQGKEKVHGWYRMFGSPTEQCSWATRQATSRASMRHAASGFLP